MDGLQGHYTKWIKSEKDEHILYDLSYMWNLNKMKQWKPSSQNQRTD